MKKILLALLMYILLFDSITSLAATSALDNLPGGAGVAYFQAGNDWETLFNV